MIIEKRGETRVLDHVKQQFLKYLTVSDVEKHSRCNILFLYKVKFSKSYVKIVIWEAAGCFFVFFVVVFCFVLFAFFIFLMYKKKS